MLRPRDFGKRTELRCWSGALSSKRPVPAHTPELGQDYTWEYATTGCVSGIRVSLNQGQQSVIALEQDGDGIHWSIAASSIE